MSQKQEIYARYIKRWSEDHPNNDELAPVILGEAETSQLWASLTKGRKIDSELRSSVMDAIPTAINSLGNFLFPNGKVLCRVEAQPFGTSRIDDKSALFPSMEAFEMFSTPLSYTMYFN